MSWLAWLVALLAVVVGILWYIESRPVQNEDWNYRMAETASDNRAKFQAEGHSAFVLGATGETGKELVKELLTSKVFSRVVLIGRREVKYEDDLYKDVEQKVVDFEKIEEHSENFKDIDVGFCCLGTTRGKAGKDGFYRVDHDYIVNSAKVAKEAGCKHFNLVSSNGANPNSSINYSKVKGQVEEELKEMNFDRLSIYRPAMIMVDRVERRPMEAVARALLKPMALLFPTAITVPASAIARSMVNTAVAPSTAKVDILENKAIHQIAGDLKPGTK